MSSHVEFPWNFLGDPNALEREHAAHWIFSHLRGNAYKGFIDGGRGFLVGPFLTDEDDTAISPEEALRRHLAGQAVGLSVAYLPGRPEVLLQTVRDEALRESVRDALQEYDPEKQCVILLQHGETAILACVVGATEDAVGPHTPRAVYYRALLEQGSDVAFRPN